MKLRDNKTNWWVHNTVTKKKKTNQMWAVVVDLLSWLQFKNFNNESYVILVNIYLLLTLLRISFVVHIVGVVWYQSVCSGCLGNFCNLHSFGVIFCRTKALRMYMWGQLFLIFFMFVVTPTLHFCKFKTKKTLWVWTIYFIPTGFWQKCFCK